MKIEISIGLGGGGRRRPRQSARVAPPPGANFVQSQLPSSTAGRASAPVDDRRCVGGRAMTAAAAWEWQTWSAFPVDVENVSLVA